MKKLFMIGAVLGLVYLVKQRQDTQNKDGNKDAATLGTTGVASDQVVSGINPVASNFVTTPTANKPPASVNNQVGNWLKGIFSLVQKPGLPAAPSVASVPATQDGKNALLNGYLGDA